MRGFWKRIPDLWCWNRWAHYALASLNASELAEQYKMLVQVNQESDGQFSPLSFQLLTTEALIDRVRPLEGITGIAICGDGGQIIYTR